MKVFKGYILNCLLFIFHLLRIQKRKILFISHLGKSYSCNPKYICEYLSKCHSSEFDLVWIYDRTCSKPTDLPPNVRAVPYFSRQYLYEIATTHYVISNTRIAPCFYFKKRPKQIYIQTWHSSLRLKKIERDAHLGQQYEYFAQNDSKKIDYIISGCAFSSQIFKSAFWYHGPIIEVGTPRIDYLKHQSSFPKELYQKAHLSKEFKYALYAPTFRKNGSLSAYNINYNILLDTLSHRFGGQWKILFRLHPNLRGVVSTPCKNNYFIDVTNYGDIQELLCIANILITDYSSCMFDMAFIGKPCILYTSDLDRYIKSERNLYFDIRSLPFPIAQNNEELKHIINAFDIQTYKKGIDSFMNSIGSFETGNACEQIYKRLLKQ